MTGALFVAAQKGDLEKVKLLLAHTHSVAELDLNGSTCLIRAAFFGRLRTVQWLLSDEGGASVTERDRAGNTVLLCAARNGHVSLMRWLLAEGGASITEADNEGNTVWSHREWRIQGFDDALSSLLKVMVMLDSAPHDFQRRLSPHHGLIVSRGQQLRARLPEYLEKQRALLVSHCPLPTVLKILVAAYAVPTTEDVWTDGLRTI
jgi:hypothetical protein